MAGTYYGIIMKVNGTNGDIIWQRRILEPNYIKRVAVTSSGKIYASTAPAHQSGAADNVLYVYQNDGTLEQEWKLTSGSGSGYYIEDIHIDKNDNAILAGYWDDNVGNSATLHDWHNLLLNYQLQYKRAVLTPLLVEIGISLLKH